MTTELKKKKSGKLFERWEKGSYEVACYYELGWAFLIYTTLVRFSRQIHDWSWETFKIQFTDSAVEFCGKVQSMGQLIWWYVSL